MAEILLTIPCVVCKGTKVQDAYNINGSIDGSKPCESCGATGVVVAQRADITPIIEELDAIFDKVKKIWNKIKDT